LVNGNTGIFPWPLIGQEAEFGGSNKRQKGAAFMTEVTGNQSAHRPIKTAQEIALYDRLVSSYGETEHDKIAAAFTAEANAVAHDASQQRWPKFARHIKQYEREQKQLHLTKGQGLTFAMFAPISEVFVS
jgi:hypothetical protein